MPAAQQEHTPVADRVRSLVASAISGPGSFTQERLAADMQRLGYREVTKRTIDGLLRKQTVLPVDRAVGLLAVMHGKAAFLLKEIEKIAAFMEDQARKDTR